MNVGVKALKNSLSRYLRAVRAGETVLVTERGKVIAELRPRMMPTPKSDDEALDALEALGAMTRGRGRAASAVPVRLKGDASASSAVVADRDD